MSDTHDPESVRFNGPDPKPLLERSAELVARSHELVNEMDKRHKRFREALRISDACRNLYAVPPQAKAPPESEEE